MDHQILNLKHLSTIDRLTVTSPWLTASAVVHITQVYFGKAGQLLITI